MLFQLIHDNAPANWQTVAIASIAAVSAIVVPIVTAWVNRQHLREVTKKQTAEVDAGAEVRAAVVADVARRQNEQIVPKLETIEKATNGQLAEAVRQISKLTEEVEHIRKACTALACLREDQRPK